MKIKNTTRIAWAAAFLLPICSQASDLRYNYTLSTNVPYDWQEVSPFVGEWKNTGEVYGCSNWSPATSSIGANIAFIQTATDCKQNQERIIQPRVKDSRTGIMKDIGQPYSESQIITAKSSREAVGILENWSSIDPTYTDWNAITRLYGCNGWSPDPSIYKTATTFSQTSSSCSTDESRTRQDREQEKYSGEIRNIGSPVTEDRTLTHQSAARAYTIEISEWSNSGAPTNCSNWSPDPNTVTVGQEFTQTASDCKQTQIRTRNESYIDHQNGLRRVAANLNETQAITTTDTRKSLGTKETWVAVTPIYSPWSNNGEVTNCSNWSPTPESITIGQTFTQTATDCEQPQARSRQDRDEETTTKEIRNNGDAVTEIQSITVSSTRSSTGTKETWVATTPTYTSWTNSGSAYSCSNWSPDPSTIDSGLTYTQTATDCSQNQIRNRQDREQETTTKVFRNIGSVISEAQTITTNATRSQTGTKVTTECLENFNVASKYSYFYRIYDKKHGNRSTKVYWSGQLIYNQPGWVQQVSKGGFIYKPSSSGNGIKKVCRTPV